MLPRGELLIGGGPMEGIMAAPVGVPARCLAGTPGGVSAGLPMK